MTRLHAVDYGAARALIEVNDSFITVDINKNDVIAVDSDPTALTAGAWMKVAADFDYPEVWRELAEASVATLDVTESAGPVRERKFRIPETVKREAANALTWVATYNRGESIVGEKLARHLTENSYVTTSDIVRMQRYFSRLSYSLTEMAGWDAGSEEFPTGERIRYSMRGGDAGLAWVNKIATKHSIQAAGGFGAPAASADGDKPHTYVADPDIPESCLICGRDADDPVHSIVASAFEYDETCDYFGIGQDPDSTVVTGLVMLRPDGTWAVREGDLWVDTEEPAETELLIMLDEDSAYTLASIIDDVLPEDPSALPYELAMMNPHEAALFYLADPELDYTLIDRLTFDIYDSTERSVNAKRQVRGPGGKFGDEPDAPDTEKQAVAETKARLPEALPLVPDVAARIAQYLGENGTPAPEAAPEAGPTSPAPGTEPVQASGELSSDYLNQLIELAEAAPQGSPTEDQQPAATTPAGPRPLYLAIVDSVDTEAVLDVVSLMPGPPPVLWKRDAAQWVQAPEILADLQGTSPPPVVELTDDAIVKNVLEQVDQATTGGEEETEETQPGASEQNPDGSPVAAKPDANPDQHPVAASSAQYWRGDKTWQVLASGIRPPSIAEFKEFEGKKRDKLAKKGYALPDGSFPIESAADLKNAISAYGRAKNKAAAKRHIIKRARGLGRADLIPADWKSESSVEEFTMWGPHGELMKLTEFAGEGGLDRNRGNAEKLRRYWERGEGALKIRWNTPGDMTRCMKLLAKYMKGREAGYCALRHHAVTGMWPGDRRNPGMGRD